MRSPCLGARTLRRFQPSTRVFARAAALAHHAFVVGAGSARPAGTLRAAAAHPAVAIVAAWASAVAACAPSGGVDGYAVSRGPSAGERSSAWGFTLVAEGDPALAGLAEVPSISDFLGDAPVASADPPPCADGVDDCPTPPGMMMASWTPPPAEGAGEAPPGPDPNAPGDPPVAPPSCDPMVEDCAAACDPTVEECAPPCSADDPDCSEPAPYHFDGSSEAAQALMRRVRPGLMARVGTLGRIGLFALSFKVAAASAVAFIVIDGVRVAVFGHPSWTGQVVGSAVEIVDALLAPATALIRAAAEALPAPGPGPGPTPMPAPLGPQGHRRDESYCWMRIGNIIYRPDYRRYPSEPIGEQTVAEHIEVRHGPGTGAASRFSQIFYNGLARHIGTTTSAPTFVCELPGDRCVWVRKDAQPVPGESGEPHHAVVSEANYVITSYPFQGGSTSSGTVRDRRTCAW